MMRKGNVNMLRNASVATKGDFIRAYDFKPMLNREDCFVEGQVVERANTEHGYTAFKIFVSKEVFGGEKISDNLVGKYVYVPHEVSFMEYAGRIINLSK
jgi:hypothetical protein